MNATELLAKRKPEWQELEALIAKFKKVNRQSVSPDKVARFTALYRSVCSDLALAKSRRLSGDVIYYLNDIVGRAHHELYRTARSKRTRFSKVLWEDVPRLILTDRIFWFSFFLFWLPFAICFFVSRFDSSFPERTVGRSALAQIERMYSTSFDKYDPSERIGMVGFYISNNAGIGLRCFAFGIVGGIIGAYILLSNSIQIGTIFGFMTSSSVDPEVTNNFTTFVTAHSSFELTAIIMAAAAGMRLGFAFFSTNGYSRMSSVRLAAQRGTPIMLTAFVLFCLAALIEGFVSPSVLPYFFKAAIAIISAIFLIVYIFIFGFLALRRYTCNEDSEEYDCFDPSDELRLLADAESTQLKNDVSDTPFENTSTVNTNLEVSRKTTQFESDRAVFNSLSMEKGQTE